MKLSEIKTKLDAEMLVDHGNDVEILTACGSDMMSDVLAYVKDQGLLLTGLNNPQVIRTCEMMDILCVVFVRGKQPEDLTLQLAREKGICVMTTQHRMYEACGLLYDAGLGKVN